MKPFVPVPFDIFSLGVAAVVHPRTLIVYLTLRRFIWRSVTTGNVTVQGLVLNGHLVARISQRRLARLVGLRRRQGVLPHLKKLVELGWVRKKPIYGGGLAYIVGERRDDHQAFFVDDWLRPLERASANQKKRPVEDQIALAAVFIDGRGGVRGAPRARVRSTERRVVRRREHKNGESI